MSEPDLILLLRLCGLTACLASFIVLISDLLLAGGRVQPDEPNAAYRILKKSDASVFWGHTLGVIAIPFCLGGHVLLGYALWPIGAWSSLAITAGLASLFLLGPFVHGLHAPIGLFLREHAEGRMTPERFGEIRVTLRRYVAGPALPLLGLFMVASLVFSGVVLMGETRLPAWMGLWCLGPLMLALHQSNRFLPGGVAGVLAPACVHVIYLPFIALVTWLLWNG